MKFSEARGIEQLKELKDNLNRNGGGSTYLPKKLQKKEVIEPLEVIEMAQPEDKAKVTTPEPKEWDNLDEFEIKDGSKFWVKNPSNFFTVAKERGSADDITQKFLPNDKTKLTIEHPKNEMGKILVIDGALNTIKNSEIYFHIEKSGGGRLQSGVLEREEFISKMKDSDAEYIPEKKESEAPKERRLKLIEKPAKNSIINNMSEKIKPDANPEKKTIKKSSEKVKSTIDKKSPEAVPPENINLKQSDLDLQDDVYVIVGRFKHYLDEKLLKVKGNEDEEKAIKELLANFEENPYSFVKKYKKDASGSKKLSKEYREENADDARTITLALKKEIPLKRKGIKINENLALDIGSAIDDPIMVSLINKYVKKEATAWEVQSIFQKGDNVYLYVKNGNGASERINTQIISNIVAKKENIITSKATKEENLKNIKELFASGGPFPGDVFTMEEKGFPTIKYTITKNQFGKIHFIVDENVSEEKILYPSDVLKALTRNEVTTVLDTSNRKEISGKEKVLDGGTRVVKPAEGKNKFEREFESNVNYYLEDKKALEEKFAELENAPKEKTEAEILQSLLKEIGKEVEITDEILDKELKTKKGLLSITKLQEKFDLSDDASNIIDKYDETLEKQKEMLAGSVNNKVIKEKLKIEQTKLDRRLSLLISSAKANGKNDDELQELGLISREDVKKNKLREIENSIINLTVNFNKRDKERTDKYGKVFTDITNKIDVEKNSDILKEIGEESSADKIAFENTIKNLKEKKAEINGTKTEVNAATSEEKNMAEFLEFTKSYAKMKKDYEETLREIEELNAKSNIENNSQAQILQNVLKEIGKDLVITDEILKNLKTSKGKLSVSKLQNQFDLSEEASDVVDKFNHYLENPNEVKAEEPKVEPTVVKIEKDNSKEIENLNKEKALKVNEYNKLVNEISGLDSQMASTKKTFELYEEVTKNDRTKIISGSPEEKISKVDLKKEVESIIKNNFAKKLEEKGLKYGGVDMTETPVGLHLVAKFEGGFVKGSPKFIADIKSTDGNIVVLPGYKLDANPIVKAFSKQDEIDNLASNLGTLMKDYISVNKGKKVESLTISNGDLIIKYDTNTLIEELEQKYDSRKASYEEAMGTASAGSSNSKQKAENLKKEIGEIEAKINNLEKKS